MDKSAKDAELAFAFEAVRNQTWDSFFKGIPRTARILEIRPGTKKKGKDIEGMGYVAEHTFAIVVPDGKRITAAFTGDEDGSLPEYEPELEMELETEAIKK